MRTTKIYKSEDESKICHKKEMERDEKGIEGKSRENKMEDVKGK